MKRILMASAALASILSVAACKREAAPATSSAAQNATTTTPATTAVVVDTPPADVVVVSQAAHAPVSQEAAAAAAAASFDTKAYAGTFSGNDTRLTLTADGTFTLDRGDSHVSGTWTLENDGKHLLFDPDSKSEPDRRYEMVGNDALQLVGDGGQRLLRDKQ